jgi:hypothetical protein
MVIETRWEDGIRIRRVWEYVSASRFSDEGISNDVDVCRVGVRAAIHQVLRKRGIDPVPLDPWYFPTVKQYEKVCPLGSWLISHPSLDPFRNVNVKREYG